MSGIGGIFLRGLIVGMAIDNLVFAAIVLFLLDAPQLFGDYHTLALITVLIIWGLTDMVLVLAISRGGGSVQNLQA